MKTSPNLPTTETLQTIYPISHKAVVAINQQRLEYSLALNSPDTDTLGVLGDCAMPGRDYRTAITEEGQRIAGAACNAKGRRTSRRLCYWKPRTNPEDWHGEETTDPFGAYETLRNQAELYAHVAAEIGQIKHLGRYARLQSIGWTGGRHVNNTDLITAAALFDPNLLIGVKSGLDGSIELALEQVVLINKLRAGQGAPAFLIYRGGTNAQDPKSWEYNYLEALEQTEGKMAVDLAHGGEMAHDPSGEFNKTIIGQIACMEHVIKLAQHGYFPAAIFAEASDLPSRTDPHMPLDIAIEGFKAVHSTKTAKVAV